jgi:hypothetical protein
MGRRSTFLMSDTRADVRRGITGGGVPMFVTTGDAGHLRVLRDAFTAVALTE